MAARHLVSTSVAKAFHAAALDAETEETPSSQQAMIVAILFLMMRSPNQ
jgi:hypothetical protein